MLFPNHNYLPYEGCAQLDTHFLDAEEQTKMFYLLKESVPWASDEVKIFGKHIIMNRKMCWMGDVDKTYNYSNVIRIPVEWNPYVLNIKNKIEYHINRKFNSCLLNFYNDGNDGMGWHSDNEKELGSDILIASLSLGANRQFYFRHNSTKEKIKLVLNGGSLLLMDDASQRHWQHSLPKSKKITEPRINLTFRYIH